MLGFVSTDNESLVSCLGDPHRAVAAYHELLRRGKDARRHHLPTDHPTRAQVTGSPSSNNP